MIKLLRNIMIYNTANRLDSKGYGSDRPFDTNNTSEGRQNNRRTEFEIIGN